MKNNVYYEAVAGEVLAFCFDYRERLIAKRDVFQEYAKSKGAKGWVGSWGDFFGLLYERDADRPKGLVAAKRKTNDGYTVWRPHGKSPEGKELRREFDDLGREPRGHEFCKRFNIPESLSYRKSEECYGTMALNAIFPDSAFIGWTGEGDDLRFWVVLPDVDGAIADKTAEGYTCDPASWTLPAGLILSSRARYDLAVAQAKVREEELEAA
jgi:hypothetical protein